MNTLHLRKTYKSTCQLKVYRKNVSSQRDDIEKTWTDKLKILVNR